MTDLARLLYLPGEGPPALIESRQSDDEFVGKFTLGDRLWYAYVVNPKLTEWTGQGWAVWEDSLIAFRENPQQFADYQWGHQDRPGWRRPGVRSPSKMAGEGKRYLRFELVG